MDHSCSIPVMTTDIEHNRIRVDDVPIWCDEFDLAAVQVGYSVMRVHPIMARIHDDNTKTTVEIMVLEKEIIQMSSSFNTYSPPPPVTGLLTRQQCCTGVCTISKRWNNSKYKSHGFFARSYNKSPYQILKRGSACWTYPKSTIRVIKKIHGMKKSLCWVDHSRAIEAGVTFEKSLLESFVEWQDCSNEEFTRDVCEGDGAP